ncbi:FAD-binding protein [Kibdelosporangium phytohabitans]|uniref:FAD-binding protein n=1 Tax=Kibdelosporangium phytohabitans TaxID=860235 RepID=UPI0012FB54B8|nr:FAD-binding protein [Kibdelosporangium phytohabitans]MBE1462882.1 hypothetical protein [Kibdelosporangium phytohabitans]
MPLLMLAERTGTTGGPIWRSRWAASSPRPCCRPATGQACWAVANFPSGIGGYAHGSTGTALLHEGELAEQGTHAELMMLDLVRPGDPRYDLSRNQFIGTRTEVLPEAVARCASPADVIEALALADTRGWPFAIRGGGHSNAGYSSSPGLVIDLTPAASISLTGSTVTAGTSVRTGQLSSVLSARELVVPVGSTANWETLRRTGRARTPTSPIRRWRTG